MNETRNQAIADARAAGQTFRQIAYEHTLSAQRVRQICNRVAERVAIAQKRERASAEAVAEFQETMVKLENLAARAAEIEAELDVLTSRYQDMSVDEMDLPVRSANFLKNAGIRTLGDLLHWSRADLLKVPNLGRKSTNAITRELARYGLSLHDHCLLSEDERRYTREARQAAGWE